jgi:son of sevenless-like protein
MLLLRDALSLLDLALLQSWLPTHAEPYLAKAQAIYDEYEKTGIEPNIITESQTTSSSATVIDSTDSESTRNSDVDYGSSVEASSYEGYGVLDDASQPLPTRHPVVSIHHENDDERKHFYKLFGKASYIILNVILASPVTDTHTLQTLFADFALPFVTKYKALYLMSEILYEDDYQNSTSDDAVINDYSEVASPWRSLLGGVLLHVKLPSLLQTLPIIHDTLDQLLQVYPLIAREKEEEREKESVRVDYNPKYLPTNKVISAATLDKLVSRLFKENPGYPHAPFEQCFFLTYRSFADADTVLDTIKRQLSRREHDEERLIRISNAIGYWVNGFYSTFTSKFLASVIRFVNQMLALSSPPEAIQQLQRNLSKNLILCLRVNRKQHNERPPRIIVPVRFKPAMLSGNVRTRFDLLEWDEIELARQMTIIDASMFHAMHYTELFEKGPNLDRLTDRFNDTSSWVIHKIVQEPDRNTRVKIYSKMVDIAYELLNLKNFHGSFAIISGLNSSPIFTLKQDLALIPKRTEERLKELGLLFRIPYSQLRKLVNETNPPCVLFVGLPLSDLIHLSENPNERKGMINFNKRLQSVGVIETFQAKQKREYNLEIVPFLMRYLSSISDELQYSQDSLYEIAQQLEKTGE